MLISNIKKNRYLIDKTLKLLGPNVMNFENKVKQKIYLFCVVRIVGSFNVLDSID